MHKTVFADAEAQSNVISMMIDKQSITFDHVDPKSATAAHRKTGALKAQSPDTKAALNSRIKAVKAKKQSKNGSQYGGFACRFKEMLFDAGFREIFYGNQLQIFYESSPEMLKKWLKEMNNSLKSPKASRLDRLNTLLTILVSMVRNPPRKIKNRACEKLRGIINSLTNTISSEPVTMTAKHKNRVHVPYIVHKYQQDEYQTRPCDGTSSVNNCLCDI